MLWSARIYHLYVATLAGCPGDNNGRGSLQKGDRVGHDPGILDTECQRFENWMVAFPEGVKHGGSSSLVAMTKWFSRPSLNYSAS